MVKKLVLKSQLIDLLQKKSSDNLLGDIRRKKMAQTIPRHVWTRDWDVLDLDPVTEIQGQSVYRKLERKLPEFIAAQVAFFRTLLVIIECILPNCAGHQKYGVVVEDNIPVVFRRHEQGHQAVYVAYKNIISRPLRVPENGDLILVGLKWRATDQSMLIDVVNAVQGVFDCLIADLRFRMMTKNFCLECLFGHTNGRGLHLERFIKTVLYHIVPWGRMKEKDQYLPLRKYERKMDMKFRRLWWGVKMIRLYCDPVKLREHCMIGSIDGSIFSGYFTDPQSNFLRNLDSITKIDVLMKCNCYGGKPRMCQSYGGLLRRVQTPRGKESEFSIVLAKWFVNGEEYEDPLWNYSVLGAAKPTEYFRKTIAEPLAQNCEHCKVFKSILDTQIPETTWLFMADICESMRKKSIYNLQGITSYQIGGVVFAPAFVLLYNTQNGRFTTLNLIEKNEWRYFDDLCGGLFKTCDPNKVKYNERINLRVFFYRKTEMNPHPCLSRAARMAPENV